MYWEFVIEVFIRWIVLCYPHHVTECYSVIWKLDKIVPYYVQSLSEQVLLVGV